MVVFVAMVHCTVFRATRACFMASITSFCVLIGLLLMLIKIPSLMCCLHFGIFALGVDFLQSVIMTPSFVVFVIKPNVSCVPVGDICICIVNKGVYL